MVSLDPDAKLKQLEGQVSSQQQHMAQVASAFTEQAVHWLASWYDEAVKSAMGQYPDAFNQSTETLKAAKKKITDLKNEARGIVDRLLAPVAWPHKLPLPTDNVDSIPDVKWTRSQPDPLLDALRPALGSLGKILLEFKLIPNSGGGPWSSGGTWAMGYSFSEPMITTLEQYISSYQKLHPLVRELVELRKQKRAGEAKKKWDDA